MEAIDDYANENIVRSVAYTVLETRQSHQYSGLLPISSQLLRQRVRILGPNLESSNSEEWDKAVQWQQDNCPSMIESLWSTGGSVADELYQKPVYYKRMDADTLHAIIEFAELDTHHYVVILLLEEGSGDMSDIKYYNTKELTEQEWIDIFENWSRTIEDAERIFLTKVTRNKRVFKAAAGDRTPGTPDSVKVKDAPEDYWGEWSSDEGEKGDHKNASHNNNHRIGIADDSEEDDSEDEYYTRWSKDPGTLTPGPDDEEVGETSEAQEEHRGGGRILQPLSALQQEEFDEEYDQSYNPLFTVPSVPNLMDAHTAALSELTHMLQNSLPGQQQQQQPMRNKGGFVQPMTQINPLPKAVSRLRSSMEEASLEEQQYNPPAPIQQAQQQRDDVFPGAYPESGTQSPVRKSSSNTENDQFTAKAAAAAAVVNKEAGRGLFMKSLSALIGAARLLGYEGKDILEMVQEIVNDA